MKRLFSAILVAGSLVLCNATPAAAHDGARDLYQRTVQYRPAVIRSKNAPSWLQRNKPFKGWYKHSSLKSNRYLSWSELYQVYRWQQTFTSRRHEPSYDDIGQHNHHDHDRYRRYWSGPGHRQFGQRRDWDKHQR